MFCLCSKLRKKNYFLYRPPFEWTEKHDDYLLREILVVEPFQFKQGSVKRGGAWTQIAEILNSVTDVNFRVNQRSVRDRLTLLEKAYRKKMRDEEKSSGIAPPDLTQNELALQEIIEKTDEFARNLENNNSKQDAEKKKAEDMRKMSMETYCETRKRSSEDEESPKSKRSRSNGSETISFLKSKSEQDNELRKSELELKKTEIELQKEQFEKQNRMAAQQQKTMSDIITQMSQQQHQLMLSQMQQNQIFAALLEKLSK